MKNKWQNYFKGKKITQLGLGLLGRGVGDAMFLCESGAELLVTDLKDARALSPSMGKLKKYGGIEFILGGHRLKDFRNRDFILKAAGTPLDSPYINEAIKNGIPIEMDASLFLKLAPKGITVIGVTGTRGKTTTAYLIYEILKQAGKRTFLAGNIKDKATSPLLKKVRAGDYVVLELDSWQLQGFGDAKISPHIAVFTTFMPDHMNYYKVDMNRYFDDKANIFKFQKPNDLLVVGEQALPFVVKKKPRARVITAKVSRLPKNWKINLRGEHNRENTACAAVVAREIGISDAVIKTCLSGFQAVPGRLQSVRKLRGVEFYNDTTATTPDATIVGLRAIGDLNRKRVILIMGGKDKVPNYRSLAAEIPKWCKALVLLKEIGTEKFKPLIQGVAFKDITVVERGELSECLREAIKLSQWGDVVLFSPAFASFGMFKNEYDRGDQFMELVRKL